MFFGRLRCSRDSFLHVVFLVLVPLIFSRDPFVFVSCPSNIFKGSFSFLFLAPLQYFQGMPLSLCFFYVMFLFLAPLIFPRDAFRDYFSPLKYFHGMPVSFCSPSSSSSNGCSSLLQHLQHLCFPVLNGTSYFGY